MTHQETMEVWIWHNYEESPSLGFQCVAWAKKYCQSRNWNIKWFWGSAFNWWVTWSPFDSTWTKIVKTPLNYPKEWDIVFWSEKRCKYGHVAVCSRLCNPITLRYSDQNGSGRWDKIQYRFGTYLNVCWWYSKK